MSSKYISPIIQDKFPHKAIRNGAAWELKADMGVEESVSMSLFAKCYGNHFAQREGKH